MSVNTVFTDKPVEEKPSKFQIIVYILGLLLIFTSFTQYYYGGRLLNENVEYQKEQENAFELRKNLQDIQAQYDELWFNLLELDLNCYQLNDEGKIIEAEKDIYGYTISFSRLWINFKDLYIENYDQPSFQWIFEEQVLTFWFFRNLSVTPTDKKLNILQNINQVFPNLNAGELDSWDIRWVDPLHINFAFSYVYATFAYVDPISGKSTYDIYDNSLSNLTVDREAPVYIEIHFDLFDAFVDEEYANPILENQKILNLLTTAANWNTIGVLVLSYLIDYDKAAKLLKIIYLLLALFSVGWGIAFSIQFF